MGTQLLEVLLEYYRGIRSRPVRNRRTGSSAP